MVDDLEPTVHFALMQILSAVYETGTVEEVALGDVLRLFGAELPGEVVVFSFRDPGWVQSYIDFKKVQAETELIMLDEDGNEVDLGKPTSGLPDDYEFPTVDDVDDEPGLDTSPNETNKKLH